MNTNSGSMKIRGKCFGCKKHKWFVRTRVVQLPMGLTARNKDLICNECFKKLNSQIQKNNVKK